MKKGSEWFKLLSKKEQQEFKENCYDFEEDMELISSFNFFIKSCFTWIITPQGHHYWQEISKRYK